VCGWSRKQQKFPFTLFDQLELMVWEALKTNHYRTSTHTAAPYVEARG
jgi:hypothetical protein